MKECKKMLSDLKASRRRTKKTRNAGFLQSLILDTNRKSGFSTTIFLI